MKQLRIEGTIPKEDKPIAEAADEYLSAKRKKKSAMEKEKAALSQLLSRMGERGVESVRILGYSIDIEASQKVSVVEMADDDEEDKEEKPKRRGPKAEQDAGFHVPEE